MNFQPGSQRRRVQQTNKSSALVRRIVQKSPGLVEAAILQNGVEILDQESYFPEPETLMNFLPIQFCASPLALNYHTFFDHVSWTRGGDLEGEIKDNPLL